jgi:hypothetical protein
MELNMIFDATDSIVSDGACLAAPCRPFAGCSAVLVEA